MSSSIRNLKKSGTAVVVSSIFLMIGSPSSNFGCSPVQENNSIAPTDILSSEMMQKDFEYVVNKLKNVHPATVEGFTETQKKIISDILKKIQRPLTKEKFFFTVNELFHSFHDAHTTQWLSFSQGIDLPLVWLQDGLYIAKNTDILRQGDWIQTIGGQQVPQLRDKLNQILWTENDHLVRLEGPWMLSARPYLEHLGLIENDGVAVTFQRAGKNHTIRIPIIRLQRPQNEDLPFFQYAIDQDHDLAVLTLNSCQYHSEYRKKLQQFFNEIHTHKIKNIVLDLRRNSGGDSRVIDKFLPYLNVDRIKTYGSRVRYSQEAREKTRVFKVGLETFPRAERRNEKINQENLLFSGRLFVLTSPKTFSSGNMFAATIQDNRIGTIVGEPTGNKPSCYGHPLPFQMPRTAISFKISHKQFFRPDSTRDLEDAVYPDVEVYRKIDDIIHHRDAQMENILKMIDFYSGKD